MTDRRIVFSAQRNEGPFLLEWVAYHRAIGMTDIIVVSNNCTDGSDLLLDALAAQGAVQHIRQTVPAGVPPQLNAAKIVLHEKLFRPGDWVIWLDLDEFLVPGFRDLTIDFLIEKLQGAKADALALNWVLMGDSDQTGLPERFVDPAFTQASKPFYQPCFLTKTLFRFDERIRGLQLHRPLWVEGSTPLVLNGGGKRLGDDFIHGTHRNGDPVARTDVVENRYRLGQINHYAVRTRQLYELKKLRGRGFAAAGDTAIRHDDDFYSRHNTNHREDTKIQRMVAGTTAQMSALLDDPATASAHAICRATALARLGDLARA